MVSFLTDTVVCGFSLYHILAYFLIYSCIGWCLEVIYAAATTGCTMRMTTSVPTPHSRQNFRQYQDVDLGILAIDGFKKRIIVE